MDNGLPPPCGNEIQRITRLIDDQRALTEQYQRYLAVVTKRKDDFGFNVFKLVSDTFYRENFHSDVLAAFFDMRGAHGEQRLFLHQFIQLLKISKPKVAAEIDPGDFLDYETEREIGRIDIRVLDRSRKKAIIVENKINNAVDQPRQLPEYVKKTESLGFQVVAIVYLSMDGLKRPSESDWFKEERPAIEPRLIQVAAFTDGKRPDLVSHWVNPCLERVSNADALVILRQYSRLLQHLGADAMNYAIMEEFHNAMLQGDNFRTAVSLREMLDGLVRHRGKRIVEMFSGRSEPFNVVYVVDSNGSVQFYVQPQGGVRVDIEVGEKCYRFYFWVNHPSGAQSSEPTAETVLREMGCLEQFTPMTGGDGNARWELRKAFDFPAEEQKLYDYIREFNQDLKKWISQDQKLRQLGAKIERVSE